MSVSVSRNQYFDFLRGIAILMVIAIHTYPHTSFDTVSGNVAVFVRQIFNAAVPLFLAISAYFLCKKPLNDWNERKLFWKKQIPKVYIPCFIWSLPLFVIAVLNSKNLVISVVSLFVCGFSIYYFIALIMQYYVLLPWLQPFRKRLLLLSAIVSAASILAITYIMALRGIGIPLIAYAGGFPVWFVFFVSGGGNLL